MLERNMLYLVRMYISYRHKKKDNGKEKIKISERFNAKVVYKKYKNVSNLVDNFLDEINLLEDVIYANFTVDNIGNNTTERVLELEYDRRNEQLQFVRTCNEEKI